MHKKLVEKVTRVLGEERKQRNLINRGRSHFEKILKDSSSSQQRQSVPETVQTNWQIKNSQIAQFKGEGLFQLASSNWRSEYPIKQRLLKQLDSLQQVDPPIDQ